MKSVEKLCVFISQKNKQSFSLVSRRTFHNSRTAYETFLKKNLPKWFKERKHCWNKCATSLDGHCERQPACETKFEKC